MNVGVIIPVGPGHERLAEDARKSVAEAFARGPGPFSAYETIVVDDTQGQRGRSAARNHGVALAGARQCEWIFFLDADDLMHPDAFRSVQPAIAAGYDAVWGAIHELDPDTGAAVPRAGQLAAVEDLTTLLINDPMHTLQMGHFVRQDVARAFPFNERLDCGEDFEYYLRVWAARRCVKLPQPLFINRRGFHSRGPRSATPKQWGDAVGALIQAHCRGSGLRRKFTYRNEPFCFFVHDPFDLIQRQHLKGRFFETAELDYLAGRLPSGLAMVEVGANIGNHAVYYDRFLQPSSIRLIEPNPVAIELLRLNLEANMVKSADTTWLGVAAGREFGLAAVYTTHAHNLGAARLRPADQGDVEVQPLDAMEIDAADFIKIDVEGMELDVLEGARQLIRRCRPALLIEVARENLAAFDAWREAEGYTVVQEFPYVNAVNLYLEARR